jgi:hypothetical protein
VPPLVTACFYYWYCELLSIEAHESWKLLLFLSKSEIRLFATYSDLERKKEKKHTQNQDSRRKTIQILRSRV